jgi:hypothetical protein
MQSQQVPNELQRLEVVWAAVGSGLGEPAAAADTAFNLPMCFLCFFFNLPTVGQSPTSGRFFF